MLRRYLVLFLLTSPLFGSILAVANCNGIITTVSNGPASCDDPLADAGASANVIMTLSGNTITLNASVTSRAYNYGFAESSGTANELMILGGIGSGYVISSGSTLFGNTGELDQFTANFPSIMVGTGNHGQVTTATIPETLGQSIAFDFFAQWYDPVGTYAGGGSGYLNASYTFSFFNADGTPAIVALADPVPEPATFGLLVLGLTLFWKRKSLSSFDR